jgi:hypothetical protein
MARTAQRVEAAFDLIQRARMLCVYRYNVVREIPSVEHISWMELLLSANMRRASAPFPVVFNLRGLPPTLPRARAHASFTGERYVRAISFTSS